MASAADFMSDFDFSSINPASCTNNRKTAMLKERKTMLGNFWRFLTLGQTYSDPKIYHEKMELLHCLDNKNFYMDFASYIATKKDLPTRWAAMEKMYARHTKKHKNCYPSVLAYVMTKNINMHKKVESLFEEYYDGCIKYESSQYSGRNTVFYDFDCHDFKIYRKALCLAIYAENNNELRNRVELLFISNFPELSDYLALYKKYGNENSFADGFLSPFLQSFMDAVDSNLEENLIIDTFVAINEIIRHFGYPLYQNIPQKVCSIFFVLHTFDRKFIPRSCIKDLCSKMEENGKNLHKELWDMDDFEINMFFLYADDIIQPFASDAITYEEQGMLYSSNRKEMEEILYIFFSDLFIRNIEEDDDEKETQDELIRCLVEGEKTLIQSYTKDETNRYSLCRKADAFDNVNLWKDFYAILRKWNSINKYAINDEDIHRPDKKQKEADSDKSEVMIAELEKEVRTLRSLDNNQKELARENTMLQKEIKELKAKLEEKDKDWKELVSLRNFIYKLQNSQTAEPEIKSESIEDISEKLNMINGVLAGGHISFQNKIHQLLPGWKMIAPGQNFTESTIANADIVVMYTDHLNHSTYIPLIKLVRNNKCKLLYIDNVNIETVIKNIYNFCIEEVFQ